MAGSLEAGSLNHRVSSVVPRDLPAKCNEHLCREPEAPNAFHLCPWVHRRRDPLLRVETLQLLQNPWMLDTDYPQRQQSSRYKIPKRKVKFIFRPTRKIERRAAPSEKKTPVGSRPGSQRGSTTPVPVQKPPSANGGILPSIGAAVAGIGIGAGVTATALAAKSEEEEQKEEENRESVVSSLKFLIFHKFIKNRFLHHPSRLLHRKPQQLMEVNLVTRNGKVSNRQCRLAKRMEIPKQDQHQSHS